MTTTVFVFGITLAAFLLVIAGMAVGVIMGRREISGSCGGLANRESGEGEMSCSLCSNPSAACEELREKMKGGNAAGAKFEECEKDCAAEGCSKEEIDACKSA